MTINILRELLGYMFYRNNSTNRAVEIEMPEIMMESFNRSLQEEMKISGFTVIAPNLQDNKNLEIGKHFTGIILDQGKVIIKHNPSDKIFSIKIIDNE